ncbi:sensor histidine kinase [Nocardia macrotermitis]|uniref:sensor histidine kinase n=1 Tax=Nocardia macrotermitis TaxID=2585198 RepID=UPI0029E81051|nr:nitrate- and nitrite sensing domain-containing protein [Nocardia macrotermitis]
MLPARFAGIRSKILAVALVPSLVLLAIGITGAVYLVITGNQAQNFAEDLRTNEIPARNLVVAAEQERLLSLWKLAGQRIEPEALPEARAAFDSALEGIIPVEVQFAETQGTSVSGTLQGFDTLRKQLPLLRKGIDTGTAPIADVYTFYSRLLDGVDQGTYTIEQSAPDIASAIQLTHAADLLGVVEAMARSISLTALAGTASGMPPTLLTEYRNQVGWYHTQLAKVQAGYVETDPATEKRIADLVAAPDWRQLSEMEDAILHPAATGRNGNSTALPMNLADWRRTAGTVENQMLQLWVDHNATAQRQSADSGTRRAHNSLVVGIGTAGLAVLGFLLSLLLANRIIGRLQRLRTETLALAQVALPETMRRLGAGEDVPAAERAARLDFGRDEIGAVAQAFNQAHTAAVDAAVTESRTREGVRAVFLNIAHRSQLVVHRQLEILDEAERGEENPAILDVYFRLDHLATRERRNAENLLILGGGRPGRQWRKPVPLMELVRSAVGETQDYARVHNGRMPQAYILGNVVGDLIHLLAELVDNATSFSPPESRVDLTGAVVGRGVAVEVTDQGMGMGAEELQRANDMLTRPPDFAVATLSADSRLGLFVVALLGARHGITVRLAESDYGGIRAIVLVPNSCVSIEPITDENAPHRIAPPPAPNAIPVAATPRMTGPSPTPARQTPTKPSLPKRRRQASLAPELSDTPQPDTPPARPTRTAEQARDLMNTIDNGTRQGRRTDPGSYPRLPDLGTPPEH